MNALRLLATLVGGAFAHLALERPAESVSEKPGAACATLFVGPPGGSPYLASNWTPRLPRSSDVVCYPDEAVTAGGTWTLDTADTSIVFDAASTTMSGDFSIGAGTLKVNQNLTTSGNLDMTGGSVTVAANKKAEFSK